MVKHTFFKYSLMTLLIVFLCLTIVSVSAQQTSEDSTSEVITSINIGSLSKLTTISGVNYKDNLLDISSNGDLVAFAPVDIVTVNTLQLGIWEAKTGNLIIQMDYEKTTDGNIRNVIFTPDNKFIITGNDSDLIQIWDVNTGHKSSAFMTHQGIINGLALSKDGKLLASAGADHSVAVLDLETGKVKVNYAHDDVVSNISFHDSGRWLASSSIDGEIIIWDLLNDIQYESLPKYSDTVTDIAFHPDEDWIALAIGYKQIQIYDMDLKNTIMETDEFGVSVVKFSPNGQFLATGAGNYVNLRDLATGKVVFTTWGGFSISFDAKGRLLVLGNSSNVEIWGINQNP